MIKTTLSTCMTWGLYIIMVLIMMLITRRLWNIFSKAFERGKFFSALLCGRIYYNGGHNVKKNIDKSVEWLKKGVQAMEAGCMCSLGQIYCSTDEKYRDVNSGIKIIGKCCKTWKHRCDELFVYVL